MQRDADVSTQVHAAGDDSHLGVGLPYAITVSLFGGTAPAVALWCKSLGHEQWFYYYLAGIIFLSLLIYTAMRDTKHESAMHRHV